jgi:hypothetical protein
MKIRKENTLPLPSGLVTVDKGRRPDILVGVLTGHRQLAQGFDVRGFAPNHFRTIEPGNFGLVIGARGAVEVQAMLDGKVLFEGILEPLQPPQPMGAVDAQRYKMLLETPQPHLIDHNVAGEAFVFEAPDPFADPSEIIANQIHPQASDPLAVQWVGMVKVARPDEHDMPAQGTGDAALPAVQLAPPVVSDEMSATHSSNHEHETLANAESAAPDHGHDHAEDGNADVEGAPAVDAHEQAAPAAQEGAQPAPEAITEEPETAALALHPHNMAPSYGFLVIGVRAIDPPNTTDEPQGPPDVFTYVGFQLNPWKLHARALSQLLNRMVVPSKEQLNDTMRKQGFAHEIPATRPVCACCNGETHR